MTEDPFFTQEASKNTTNGGPNKPTLFGSSCWSLFYVISKSVHADTSELQVDGFLFLGSDVFLSAYCYSHWTDYHQSNLCNSIFNQLQVGKFFRIYSKQEYFALDKTALKLCCMLHDIEQIHLVNEQIFSEEVTCSLSQHEHFTSFNWHNISYKTTFQFASIFSSCTHDEGE